MKSYDVQKREERKILRKLARALRSSATPMEKRLWKHMKGQRLGWKFRRQHVLLPYIVDFYCPARRLVVELDGAGHNREYDKRRDRYLASEHRVRVLRFSNREVKWELERVVDAVADALEPEP